MNKQQVNGYELCQKLQFEEFRYWNYSRVTNSQDQLEVIKRNVDEIRSTISELLSNRKTD